MPYLCNFYPAHAYPKPSQVQELGGVERRQVPQLRLLIYSMEIQSDMTERDEKAHQHTPSLKQISE